MTAVVILLVLIVLSPALFVVQMSFKTGLEAFQMPPTFTFRATLQNYADVLQGKFVRALANSTLTATAATVLALVLGVPAAYALSRVRFAGARLVSLWTLSTRMAPAIAFGIPFFLIYKNLDLIDTRLGL